jgi:putative SOS response-associated peptidase YedK
MCGRYTVLTEDEIIEIREILKNLSMRIVRDDFENYDEEPGELFPTNHAPVITKKDSGIAFESAKWGFKKWNSSGVIINARSETMKKKSTFSHLLETGHCIVPAGEFFEWERLPTGKKKYYAKDKSGNLLFMAGLYRDNGDEREFVIITKKATGEMAKIHDRIPVILRTDQIESWLTGEITPEDIANMNYDVNVTPCEDDDDKQVQISLF